VTVAGVLARVLTELRGLDLDVPPEELCEALWLCQQGVPPLGDRPASAREAPPAPGGPHHRREAGGRGPARHNQAPPGIYLRGQAGGGAEQAGEPSPATTVWLPDSPALPDARELARALRPLRYDPRRTYRTGDIDEEATANRIAEAGIRVPVWRTTRRRRLDVDLVLDLGGSGPLWEQLAAELRTMLEIHGAFRTVRFWTLDSDSADLPLRIGHLDPGAASTPGALRPWDAICPPLRRPIVIVLTDGTGRTWQSGQAHRPLRRWAGHGRVLLVQMLPPDMWSRTALRALPVTFFPADDGYHSGARIDVEEADLSVVGLDQDDLPAATAIPVIGLDVPWLRSWLPLLRGAQSGAVPGYALLIRGQDGGGQAPDPVEESWIADTAHDLTAEERVQRFLVTASGDAVKLARLLSVVHDGFHLTVMRKITHELLRHAKPPVMAEVMLSGLLYWTSPAGTTIPSGTMTFTWYSDDVRELLQERPYGETQFEQDKARVWAALRSDNGIGRRYPAIEVGPGKGSVTNLPTTAKPLIPGPRTEPSPVGVAAMVPAKEDAEPSTRTVRIGIWGSTQSGRTTFLTVLAGLGWQRWRGGEEWRVLPANRTTEELVKKRRRQLAEGKKFPDNTLPRVAEQLSFQLERKRREGSGLLRWLRPKRVAQITLQLQDRAGEQFGGERRQASANSYLADSDVLLYFFDPTYDDPYDAPKYHSVDFFAAVEAHLAMAAAQDDDLHGPFLPKHIAVCMPKLDDQRVFNAARFYGCAETDPDTGLPWVPSRLAGLLLEKIFQDQHRHEADFLFSRLRSSFAPDRISFHALSSVGFWIPENGEFDPRDVCNVVDVPQPEGSASPPARRVRGEIRPLHVLDPLISLVQRAEPES
jgi:hypothetical protein